MRLINADEFFENFPELSIEPYINAPTVEIPNYSGQVVPDTLQGWRYEERPQGELKEYKPLELDYNVQIAVENLKKAYWSNEPEKVAKAFTEAEDIIISAICHHDYIVCKRPQGEWIPVNERLPESGKNVLVTSKGGYVYITQILCGEWEYGGEVIAWQPLPEPYMKGSKE